VRTENESPAIDESEAAVKNRNSLFSLVLVLSAAGFFATWLAALPGAGRQAPDERAALLTRLPAAGSRIGCPAPGDSASLIQKASATAAAESPKLEAFSPPPEFFPILPWDPFHGWREPFITDRRFGLESLAECRFSVAGFVWTEDLPVCEGLGLAAIVIPDVAFLSPQDWAALSESEIDAIIKSAVDRTASSPAVIGYFITDEPGATHFKALAAAVRAVKLYAPGKLAYINLFPDYATTGAAGRSQLETASYTEYLERYVREVRPQFLSYDNYQVEYSGDLKKPKETASYFRNLLEVRRVALANGLPFWNIVASNQLRAEAAVPSPSNLLLQAYTTLAAGGRGLSWYTYYSQGYAYAPIDENGNRTTRWHWLEEVNRQVSVLGPTMNRLRSTGVFFSAPPPAEGLPALPGRVVASVESDAPLMIGEFKGSDGTDFVMVVNLSLERSAKFKVVAAPARRDAKIVSAEDGTLGPLDNKHGQWLVAGQGVLMRFGKE
jgi:hypothetical protein